MKQTVPQHPSKADLGAFALGKLKPDLKVTLYDKLTDKFNVLPEKGAQYKNVNPKDATCFHCY